MFLFARFLPKSVANQNIAGYCISARGRKSKFKVYHTVQATVHFSRRLMVCTFNVINERLMKR